VCVFVCKSVYTHVYSNDTKIMHQKRWRRKKTFFSSTRMQYLIMKQQYSTQVLWK